MSIAELRRQEKAHPSLRELDERSAVPHIVGAKTLAALKRIYPPFCFDSLLTPSRSDGVLPAVDILDGTKR